MTQLPLKSGLKAWRDKAHEAAVAKMSILHFRNTLEPLHWRQLSDTGRKTVLEYHMFSRRSGMGRSKAERWREGTSSVSTSPKKMQVRQPSRSNQSYYRASSTQRGEGSCRDRHSQCLYPDRGRSRERYGNYQAPTTLADILVNIAPDVYNAYATTDKKE
jgi:hypothetical protein